MASDVQARAEPARERIHELARRELGALNERTRASEALFRRAASVMPGGVPSSFQLREPWPVYMAGGEGSRVWDADGNEYADFHNGFGAMVQGHAHPAIEAAVGARRARGTHFGAPTEDAVAVAEELARRFPLPHWRFTNSGTESTMAAVRIARALTGREDVVAIAGGYHGHHDTALAVRGVTGGIPRSALELVHVVPFDDAGAMEGKLAELGRDGRPPACVLMEPVMTHGGIVPPGPGYLQALRELTRRHGAVLILDEVKTGLAIAAGGASGRFGVEPDLVTLAKALGGGPPSGAVGMSGEAAALVESGEVPVFGTFNGNPLSMAAARANLLEVLVPAAYARLERLGERMAERLPGPTVALGARGCVSGSGDDADLAELAWLWAMNRGVLTTRGRGLEWTLSVAHADADVDRYADVFAELAAELSR
jgi:glutamate-1-semialdehyde 2,1-aminomutase